MTDINKEKEKLDTLESHLNSLRGNVNQKIDSFISLMILNCLLLIYILHSPSSHEVTIALTVLISIEIIGYLVYKLIMANCELSTKKYEKFYKLMNHFPIAQEIGQAKLKKNNKIIFANYRSILKKLLKIQRKIIADKEQQILDQDLSSVKNKILAKI